MDVSHVELTVADAAGQAAALAERGFEPVAMATAERRLRAVRRGPVVLVMRDADKPRPAPTVDIALRTPDAHAAFAHAVAAGATALSAPERRSDGCTAAAVRVTDELAHTLVQVPSTAASGAWLPGSGPIPTATAGRAVPSAYIAVRVPTGRLAAVAALCERALELCAVAGERLVIGPHQVISRVLRGKPGTIALVLVELPADESDWCAPPHPIRGIAPAIAGVLANGTAVAQLNAQDAAWRAAEYAAAGAEQLLDPDTYSRLVAERGYYGSRTWASVGGVHIGVADDSAGSW